MSAAADYLRSRLPFDLDVFVILGSGLGALGDDFSDPVSISFDEIPGFAAASVEGHQGRLLAGRLGGKCVLLMQGRMHMYEGHSAATVSLPVRVAADLGIKKLIVSNAAGGINRTFRPGDLMLIDDQINLLWDNPLIGPVRNGELRFPDMSQPYDAEMRSLARSMAQKQGIALVEGTYLSVSGPSYETPAEIRMYQRLGADAIGMSTVPEVVAARANGMRVLGFSLIANLAAGYTLKPVTHDEVIEAGARASASFSKLVRGIIAEL
jgi:purine-nucleoside phosphorylase